MTCIDGFDFIGFIMIFNREDKINNQKFYILGHDLLISLFLFSFFIDVLVLLSVDCKYEQVKYTYQVNGYEYFLLLPFLMPSIW